MSKSKRLWLVLQCKRQRMQQLAPACRFDLDESEISLQQYADRLAYEALDDECRRLDALLTAQAILKELRS